MQPVIITARRSDASLIARLELDPEPDRVIGDDLLDRVATILNGNAANLSVASIEVFPPALVADHALLEGWKRTIPNIAGNACFSRPKDDGLDGLRHAIAAGFDAQADVDAILSEASSEPVSEPISGAISEPKSEVKSEDDFRLPDLGESAVLDEALNLLVELQNPAVSLEQQRLLAAIHNKLYDAPDPARIVVVMDGGLIQNVARIGEPNADVVVVDYDVDGADPSEYVQVPQDAVVWDQKPEPEPAFVFGWRDLEPLDPAGPFASFLAEQLVPAAVAPFSGDPKHAVAGIVAKPAQPKCHLEIAQIVAGLEALDWDLVAAAHENREEPFWTIVAKRQRPVFPNSPYVVCDFDYSGISNGHYDLSRERAFRVFTDKVAGREEV